MSSIVDALYELKYNPFEYGPYLASFYTHLTESENNLLLAQLVIPLCSYPLYSYKLLNSNKRSSIWSVFDDRTKLYDLQERIVMRDEIISAFFCDNYLVTHISNDAKLFHFNSY